MQDGRTASWLRQYLQARLGPIVAANLSSHDQDGTIGQDRGGWVPPSPLERQNLVVLFPIGRRVGSFDAIGGEKTDTESGLKRPATDVDLAADLVGEDDRAGTEDVGLDVHFAPGGGEVVCETDVELIGTCGVRESKE